MKLLIEFISHNIEYYLNIYLHLMWVQPNQHCSTDIDGHMCNLSIGNKVFHKIWLDFLYVLGAAEAVAHLEWNNIYIFN